MNDTATPSATVAPAPAPRPLDDVMIAMDVVDTLRHDARIVERELNDETRRAELIERLREIYRGQGIDVPDAILEDGVKALEEKRFVYVPPADTLLTRAARLYVTRDQWGRWVMGALAGIVLLWGGWYLTVEWPRQSALASIEREASVELPAQIAALAKQIGSEAKSDTVKAEVIGLEQVGLSAARDRNLDTARTVARDLTTMRDELQRQYDVRIVSRPGEVSGLWRIPKVNPGQRNYYLVVEAIGRDGAAQARDVLNEETGKRQRVSQWAVRVPKTTFDAVQADKLDDGIIQNATIGSKVPGDLEPRWLTGVEGGALTEW
jgi:Family of unknown function (DUF6384)